MSVFQILINEQCKANPEPSLAQELPPAPNPSLSSSLQPSSGAIPASVKDNNGLKTQLSSAQPRFGNFQSRNLYRTTYDAPKYKAGGVYNIQHRIYVDYSNGESIHKVENKENYIENSTLTLAPKHKQKRSVNISTYVRESVRRENYPVNERSLYHCKRAKCKTKRPLVNIANHLESETRTRVRRSDEQQENYVDFEKEHTTEKSYMHKVTNESVCDFETTTVASIYPQYFIYTWVLCMVALASFLKLNYLVKTIVLVFMVTCYGILIINFSSEISICYR